MGFYRYYTRHRKFIRQFLVAIPDKTSFDEVMVNMKCALKICIVLHLALWVCTHLI